MDKIKMNVPLVEMDGDEMTRVLWRIIRDDLIRPYVDLKTEYYDLGILRRDETADQVTLDAARATARLGVAVKCATITPNKQRQEEYDLSQILPSPNGTIRAVLDGTAFRAPILLPFLQSAVPGWEKPITVARHAYGDMYKAVELVTEEPGEATLYFDGKSGHKEALRIAKTKGPAVFLGQHNTHTSIRAFVLSCFQYALDTKQDLWFSAKDTISKEYDGAFRQAFEEIYEEQFKEKFDALGLNYFYTLIDDAVSRVMRSKGGFVWALKNYDGDVMSDMVAAAFGSLAMMTSVLMAPDGSAEFEASHGTVVRHFYRYQAGEMPSTNSTATIFAWSGALRRRGQLDKLPNLIDFAGQLEGACLDTMKAGLLTGDLAKLVDEQHCRRVVDFQESLEAIARRLEGRMRTR
jgi:isocitrate dehydrogenase